MLRRPETQKVAAFLYDLLVANPPTKDYATRVAEKMNLPYASLARYWQGRAVFPAGLVRSLFLATAEDQRVAEFFLLDGSAYRLERRGTATTPPEISRALMSISHLEGEVSGLYLRATQEDSDEGRAISFAEARNLEEALRKLTRVTEELRTVIRKLHQ